VERELSTPLYGDCAPLVRAVLLHAPRRSVIILTAHHSTADGLSLAAALRDTIWAAGRQPLTWLPGSPSQDELLGLRHDTPGGTSGIHFVNTRTSGAPGMTSDLTQKPDVPAGRISSTSLAPDMILRLQLRARQEKATVHEALCAAIATAGRQVSTQWTEKCLRVLSPVDIRSLLKISQESRLGMPRS